MPSTDLSIQGYRMAPYSPVGTGITPVKFSIPALDDFVDLNCSYFAIDLRLYTTGTGGIVPDANSASNANAVKFMYVTNNFAHTIFKQINLRFNGTLMSEQTDTYAYSAFLQTLLNYSQDDGETLLAPQGWVNFFNVTPTLTAAGANDDICTTDGYEHNDTNALKTATITFHGKTVVRLFMRPYLPAFYTGKALAPGVEMTLQLYLNSPDFFMWGTKTSGAGVKPAVQVRPEDIDVTFHLCRLSLHPDTYSRLITRRQVQHEWTQYPVVRHEIRTFSFDRYTTTFKENNPFLGRVPQRMIVGLLDSTAVNDDVEKYPFAFQKKGAKSMRQIINGEGYPYVTLDLDGTSGSKDLEGYRCLLEAAGSVSKHREFMLKPGDWGHSKDCTLFMWNNVPSGDADGPKMNPKQTGGVRLEITFDAALNANITVLAWGEFETLIEIDSKGGVLYDIRA